MRRIISAICNKHGYHKGEICPKCDMCEVEETFNTNKDKLYSFHSSSLGIDIESKSQWKRELKKRGLTDDFNQSKLEIGSHREHKLSHEELKNSIRQEMKDRGIYSREKLFLKK